MKAAPIAITALLATILESCDKPPIVATFVPIAGSVTYDGRRLKEALVSFYPKDSTPDQTPGEGVTDPEGNYEAKTGDRRGLRPGIYRVQVTTGPKPSEAKVGDSIRFYGETWRVVPASGVRIDLNLMPEMSNVSY